MFTRRTLQYALAATALACLVLSPLEHACAQRRSTRSSTRGPTDTSTGRQAGGEERGQPDAQAWLFTRGPESFHPTTTREGPAGGPALVCATVPYRHFTFRSRERLTLVDSGAFSFEIFIPADAPEGVQTAIWIKDADFWWFQKLHEATLRPGRWNTVSFPFDQPEATSHVEQLAKHFWQGVGHSKPWDRQGLSRIREIGLRFVTSSDYIGDVVIANIGGRPERRAEPRPPRIGNFQVNARHVPRYRLFEITFDLDKGYENPFSPEQINIVATFTAPSGKTAQATGFIFQDYERRRTEGRSFTYNYQRKSDLRVTVHEVEELVPVGAPCWKVRFTPTEPGEYTYVLRVTDEVGETATAPRRFTCTPSDEKGFVRISPRNPSCFEFDNGEPFFPIGLNLHSSYDIRYRRLAGRGLEPTDERSFFYERMLSNLSANGANLAEVWCSAWGYALEWLDDWYGFDGLGRYNLMNAWRLDTLLEHARRTDMRILLVYKNHGQFSDRVDPEWYKSPYNARNGGFLRSVNGVFTSRRALKNQQRELRYLMARYGHSPNIFCFEILSETDLAGGYGWSYRSSTFRRWLRRIATYVREHDPNDHLITNHYSGYYRVADKKVFQMPEIDFAVCDGYRNGYDLPTLFAKTAEMAAGFTKPIMITEFGGDWYGGSRTMLEDDLHAGLWLSWTLRWFGGAALTWWYEFVDDYRLYFHYRAFAAYAAGEDRRDPALQNTVAQARDAATGAEVPLGAVLLKSDARAYVWVFHTEVYAETDYLRTYPSRSIFDMPGRHPSAVSGAILDVKKMRPGTYLVEYWDTRTGKVIATRTIAAARTLRVPLPKVSRDIALKINPAPPGEGTAGEATPR